MEAKGRPKTHTKKKNLGHRKNGKYNDINRAEKNK
jgi:hypothetical protein